MILAPAASAQSASECAQDGDTLKCTYVENGTDPVAEFSATDPDEGDDTTVWSVVEAGVDTGNFEISDEGVLTFKSAPSFEGPKSSVTSGTLDARNVYALVVEVRDGTDNSEVGTLKVQVTVTDVEEEGTGALTELQPQVSVQLSVKDFDDPDGEVSRTTWQWSKSMDMTDWTDIDGTTSDRYTPATDDEGYYLRALATYTDRRGSGKTTEIVSQNAVEEKTASNTAPDFGKEDSDGNGTDETGDATATPPAPFLRTMKENTKDMAVGSPVSASDADGDVLQYTHGGADEDCFKVDVSGQLTAAKDLDFEAPTVGCDSTADAATTRDGNDNIYAVTVTATDPSGAETTVTVNITVENANDAPVFGDTAKAQIRLTVNERIGDETDTPAIQTTGDSPAEIEDFEATDADTEPADDVVSYSVGGDDGGNFLISATGELTFKADKQPNYEGQSRYDITIIAKDDDDIPATAELDVRIDVNNREEDGTVTLSQRQFQVGVPVTAKLDDPDKGVTGLRWQWSAQDAEGGGTCPTAGDPVDSDETSGWVAIANATGATYTPLASHGDRDDTTEGDQPVCLQVTANYNDGFANPATQTDEADTDVLDESKDVANGLLAGSGSAVEPRRTANAAPKFAEEDANDDGTMEDGTAANPFLRDVDENAEDAPVGTPLSASDDHGGADVLIFTHGGADKDSFTIDRDDGQLSVDGELDYETQSEYMVTVTATDPSLASKMVNVMVTVNDKDDGADIMPASEASECEQDGDTYKCTYVENGTDPVATLTATDSDEGEDTIVWSVVEADVETGNFEISDEGVLTFKSAPSFEGPKSSVTSGTLDARNVYALVVEVRDGTDNSEVGTLKVQVTVTDVEEEGTGALTELQPQVSVQLSVKDFDDPDGEVSRTMWQWSKSMDMTDWTDIDGAISDRYTPATDDEGYYLRALATYTDRRGSGKTTEIVSQNAVEEKTTANTAPDFGKEDSDRNDADETGSDTAPFLRTMKENTKDMAVGSPVSATDADGDVLQYTHGGADMAKFKIDESGQLTAAVDLNFEETDTSADDQCAVANACVVTVTATDPSGAETTVTVNITVENANDAPVFGDTAKAQIRLQVNEKIAADDTTNPAIQTTEESPGNIRAFEATDADRSRKTRVSTCLPLSRRRTTGPTANW